MAFLQCYDDEWASRCRVRVFNIILLRCSRTLSGIEQLLSLIADVSQWHFSFLGVAWTSLPSLLLKVLWGKMPVDLSSSSGMWSVLTSWGALQLLLQFFCFVGNTSVLDHKPGVFLGTLALFVFCESNLHYLLGLLFIPTFSTYLLVRLGRPDLIFLK